MAVLPYSVREGLAGFRRAKFAAVASTSAMTVALVLIGLFALLTYEAQHVYEWLRQRVGEVELFLDDATDPAAAEALYQRAAATFGVDEAEYVSQEEAQRIFRAEFGEEADLFMDEPFLPASIKVRVEPDYANPDSLTALSERFATWNRVDEVVFNQPLLVKVQQNLRVLSIVGLSLGALVVLAAIFLVGNTIRLTIYARRLLIRTMKLVGATDAFIRRPFIVEGIAQGLLAALVALAGISALYALMTAYVPALASRGWAESALLVGGLLLLGVLLGWAGSYLAVRRFIKNVALH